MKKSTPVIMGILLIIGVAALGYLDQFHNQTNNSSSNHSFIGEHTLKGNLKSIPSNSTPSNIRSTSSNVSTNNTFQNTTDTQNQNNTPPRPSGS